MTINNLKELFQKIDNTRRVFETLVELDILEENMTKTCLICFSGTLRLRINKNTKTGKMLRCDNNLCRAQKINILEDTYLARKCIGTTLVILGCFLNSRKITEVVVDWGYDTKTVEKLYSEIRDVCVKYLEINPLVLGGPGKTVEIDESHVFNRKYNRGRILRSQQVWVFGLYERGSKKIHLEIVNKRDKETLLNVIQTKVNPDTLLMTDEWPGYVEIQKKYTTLSVCHKYYFVDPQDSTIHTNSIERLWRSLKIAIRGSYGDNYEKAIKLFVFRKNYLSGDFFQDLIFLINLLKYFITLHFFKKML